MQAKQSGRNDEVERIGYLQIVSFVQNSDLEQISFGSQVFTWKLPALDGSDYTKHQEIQLEELSGNIKQAKGRQRLNQLSPQ